MAIDNRRIAKNTVMLYLRMMLLMVVSLYTSRVILSALGVNDFGIYNLIGGFITLFSFISQSLVGAVQRYLNVSLGKGDNQGYQRIYSMSINLFAILSLLLLIVGETIGLWFVMTQFNIPSGREDAVFWVYQMSLITLIVNLFRIPDQASIVAHEKMEFYAYISIFEAVLKLCIVYLLGCIAVDKLILYVFLYLGSTVIINFIYHLYCRINILVCRYRFMWNRGLSKNLISFSGWNMFSSGARVVKSQGDAFFLNHYYSVSVNAAFGVASQVYNAVNLFLTNFQTAFNPQLVQSYAAGDMRGHYRLIMRSAKWSFCLLLIIVVPVLFNLEALLGLWLEEVPLYTREFCIFVMLSYLIDALGAPLGVSVNANGEIKIMHLVSSAILLIGLLSGFLFLKAGAPPYIISIIILFVHIGFWINYMYNARRYSHISLREYAKTVILPVIIVSAISVSIPMVLYFSLGNFSETLVACFADFLWASTVIYILGLSKEERKYILTLLKNILKKLNINNGKTENGGG